MRNASFCFDNICYLHNQTKEASLWIQTFMSTHYNSNIAICQKDYKRTKLMWIKATVSIQNIMTIIIDKSIKFITSESRI